MTEMVYGQMPVRAGEPILPRWWRTVDRWTLSCVLMLFGVGLLLGFAASPPLASRNGLQPFYYVERQAFFGIVALMIMVVVSMLSPRLLRRIGVVGFGAMFVALAFLPVFGTDFGQGAVRWYSLRVGSLQPSEFLKPFFIITCAWMLAASDAPDGPPGRLISLALTGAVVGFLAIQPDFGQAALFLFTWGVMYFVAGASIVILGLAVGATLLAGVFLYGSSEHFARRIDGFLSPEIDPRTQLGYAANAIQEGGIFGVGVGEGRVKWSLPDAHTDFIIAVAAEEYGLILVLLVLTLFATIALRALFRLLRERDTFTRLAGTGLAAMLAAQALINIGVAARVLPAKGMTLPFVSYGGSSLIAAGLALGMLMAFTRTRPQGEIGDILLRRGL